MSETNNSKNIFENLSVFSILNIVSITLSVVVIIISIVAIAKNPNNNYKDFNFANRDKIWEEHKPDFWADNFNQNKETDSKKLQKDGLRKIPNKKNRNSTDDTKNDTGNVDIENSKNSFNDINGNRKNNPRIDNNRQNNTY